ncbi:acyltransferase family protein [Acetobacter sp. UBA5411]|uniref:acyltransferase family protein n=1 Tax=Acetobacter sp. UBA5411 TaxID=1945905 RepID=UPI0038D0C7B5
MLKRDLKVDTARGIACILLVSYHTIGYSPLTGLRLAADSPIAIVNSWLAYLRMPLFTILSGIVYAWRPVLPGHTIAFLKGKVLRLILPLICVGYLFAVVQMITPGANYKVSLEQFPFLMFWPYEHFWFLQSLFIIFIVISFIDKNNSLKTNKGFISIFFLSSILFVYRDNFTTFFFIQ